MKERTNGFYWIKEKQDGLWVVGEWSDDTWFIPGDYYDYEDHQLEDIGEYVGSFPINEKCPCGNNLTQKEILHDTCLCCFANISDEVLNG